MDSLFSSADRTPYNALLEGAHSFNQPFLRRHELWAITCYFRALHGFPTEERSVFSEWLGTFG